MAIHNDTVSREKSHREVDCSLETSCYALVALSTASGFADDEMCNDENVRACKTCCTSTTPSLLYENVAPARRRQLRDFRKKIVAIYHGTHREVDCFSVPLRNDETCNDETRGRYVAIHSIIVNGLLHCVRNDETCNDEMCCAINRKRFRR